MPKNTIIIQSGYRWQVGFVRMYYPMLISNTDLGCQEFFVEHHHHPVHDAELMKDVQSVVIQRPVSEIDVTVASYYAYYRNTYKYNLVFEFDDMLWDIPKNCENILKIANLPNFVVVSTRQLAREWKKISNRPVIVMPNGVPGFMVSNPHMEIKENEFAERRPVVLYGGSAGHDLDFNASWVNWLKDSIKNDKIEFHSFVLPEVLEEVKDKIIQHDFKTPVDWLNYAARIHPDFYIAPLENNNINHCKSDLKVKEAAAMGCVFLGSDIPDGPYSRIPKEMLVNSTDNASEKFENLLKPEVYNKMRNWLVTNYNERGWCITHPDFIKRWLNAYANGKEV